MKSKIFKPLILMFGVLACGALPAVCGVCGTFNTTENFNFIDTNGVKQEFTRTINREFPTTSDGMTALYNKYGKVTVNTWQQNTVKIDITIVVNASDAKAADRVFNRINVNFAQATGYVKAETIIQPENQSSWSWSWASNSNSSCQDFKINYNVWMPVSNALDLKNKYGDSFLTQLDGKLTAEIKYGNLRTDNINNMCELWLGYGKASFQKVQNLSGQVEYGELNLSAARDIEMETKYSNLKVEKANDLRLVSKYDDFTIGEVNSIRLQTKYSDVKLQFTQSLFLTSQYTDVKINGLGQVLDADMTYGNLKIENLHRNFSEVRLNGKYTDFKLMMERGASFRFDAEGSYANLKYPTGATVRNQVDKNSWSSVKGFVGDENARGTVKAKLTYGDLVMR